MASKEFAKAFTSLLAISTIFVSLVASLNTLSVDTNIGRIHGITERTAPNVAQFLGIPYAEPPIGSRRFKPAVKKRFARNFDASIQGPACYQTISDAPAGYSYPPEFLINSNVAEDCLYLNVWAPYNKRKGLLPVVVWIHGGGFQIVRDVLLPDCIKL